MADILYNENETLRIPLLLLWNVNEHRFRSPIRIGVGLLLVVFFAGLGGGYRPTLLSASGPVTEAVNTFVRGIPQTVGLVLGVILVTVVIDRRLLTDLGMKFELDTWRRAAGGTALGIGITTLSVLVGVLIGYYDVTGFHVIGGPTIWLVIVIIIGLSQLFTVIAEELLARGFIITNITEGFERVPAIPRGVAAGVAIVAASIFFYFTHSVRGAVFGMMAAGLAVLLGVAYVLSGDIAVPIGIHFGVNFAGGLIGTQPMSASLIDLTAPTTVADSLVLPVEAVVVRLAGSAIAIGILFWWYRSVTGSIRVAPSIARPMLRWRRDR